MLYRAHCEGFSDNFKTVDDLKAWALRLLAKYPDLRGKEVVIHKATWVGRDCAQYSGKPSKVCLLGV